MDMIIIQPDKGKAAEIGQQLLSLADSPYQVQWVSWPLAGYKVPVELAEKLGKLRGTEENTATEAQSDTAETPRRRGRPRKPVEETVPDTDDTEKEE